MNFAPYSTLTVITSHNYNKTDQQLTDESDLIWRITQENQYFCSLIPTIHKYDTVSDLKAHDTRS